MQLLTKSRRRALSPLLFAALLLGGGHALAAGGKGKLGIRDALSHARREFQVYRGRFLERFSDRITVGRSTFDKGKSVAQNLAALAKEKGIEHYYKQVGGRDVLHLVVDLGQGKKTKQTLRSVLGRVGEQTVELNFKAPGGRNAYGHVAVRVGNGALYDLTGTRGVEQLPGLIGSALKLLTGSSDLSLARKRSLRRFFESRPDDGKTNIYFGMLYGAKPNEVTQLASAYEKRAKSMKSFSVSGGNAADGVYSCAQFLSEALPFWNERGVQRTIGARSMASAAARSPQLEAVIVYKPASLATSGLPQI
ncbi:MAG: hypothetical protein KC503_44590 [Myxococcales bacterium]|nr:hypothetical protein [Myxococcales bacterium]